MKKIITGFYRIAEHYLLGTGIASIYPFNKINQFVINRIKRDKVSIMGHEMHLDSNDTLHLSINGIYEAELTNLIINKIKRDSIVLDIGAHIGYFTLILARLVGPQGKIYAFEPDPQNFKILKENIEANGYKNVVLVQSAVSDVTGKQRLYTSRDNSGDHRTYNTKNRRSSIEIDVISLDDYFKNMAVDIDFIKMDIQGSEYKALKGAANVLKNSNNLSLITELWPTGLSESGSSAIEYVDALEKQGFQLYEIGKKILRPFSLKKLNHKFVISYYTSLLCLK